uniref:Uncharacterized protein n=1 Tax=Chenopodium quinoa TaxID=63459 RepID=A0A803MTC4_CHEQI
MANSTVTLLKAVFIALGSVMVATLIYTIAIDDGWQQLWWTSISIFLFWRITTCTYIAIQLFKLSAEESAHDPMYHLLLRQQDKKDAFSGSALHLIAAKVIFSALGFLMLGTLVYTLITNGSPFKKELLVPCGVWLCDRGRRLVVESAAYLSLDHGLGVELAAQLTYLGWLQGIKLVKCSHLDYFVDMFWQNKLKKVKVLENMEGDVSIELDNYDLNKLLVFMPGQKADMRRQQYGKSKLQASFSTHLNCYGAPIF